MSSKARSTNIYKNDKTNDARKKSLDTDENNQVSQNKLKVFDAKSDKINQSEIYKLHRKSDATNEGDADKTRHKSVKVDQHDKDCHNQAVSTLTGTVIEAGGIDNAIPGTPTVTGSVANTFTAITNPAAATYGTYTIDAAGLWSYTLNNNNSTVQALNVGQSTTDTFTVTAIDGTQKNITITINGTNDAAVITGTSTGTVADLAALSSNTLVTKINIVDSLKNITSHFPELIAAMNAGELGDITLIDPKDLQVSGSDVNANFIGGVPAINQLATHFTNISPEGITITNVDVISNNSGGLDTYAYGFAAANFVGKVILSNTWTDSQGITVNAGIYADPPANTIHKNLPWIQYSQYAANIDNFHKIYAADGVTHAVTAVINVDSIDHVRSLFEQDPYVYGASLVNSNNAYTTFDNFNEYRIGQLGSYANLTVFNAPADALTTQFINNLPVISGKTIKFEIQDTSTNILANLGLLEANISKISGIKLSDPQSVITVTQEQYFADKAVLDLIPGNYQVALTDISVAQLQKISNFSEITSIAIADTGVNIHSYFNVSGDVAPATPAHIIPSAISSLGSKLTHLTLTDYSGGWGNSTLSTLFNNLSALGDNSVTIENVSISYVLGSTGNITTKAFTLANLSQVDKVLLAPNWSDSSGNPILYGSSGSSGIYSDSSHAFTKQLPFIGYSSYVQNPDALHKIFAGDGTTAAVTAIQNVDTLDHLYTILANDSSIWGATIGDTGYTTTAYKSMYSIAKIGSTTNLVVMDPIFGTVADDFLVGGATNNYINGEDGNDTINGMGGANLLIGGSGNDTFAFSDHAQGKLDTIADFISGQDHLEFYLSGFAGLGSQGALSTSQFYSAAGAVSALDADQRMIYDTTSGALYYDADGLGGDASVQVALIGQENHPIIANTDIQIIA